MLLPLSASLVSQKQMLLPGCRKLSPCFTHYIGALEHHLKLGGRVTPFFSHFPTVHFSMTLTKYEIVQGSSSSRYFYSCFLSWGICSYERSHITSLQNFRKTQMTFQVEMVDCWPGNTDSRHLVFPGMK